MPKTITLQLSEQSINKAIKELQRYEKWVAQKTAQLTERLALLGAHEASVRFAAAMYDGENDVSVTVEPVESGWAIKASGDSVCFIEFGAGVYYNGSEPYPNRPPEVAKIGEYGKGKGKRNAWGYYDDSGNLVITHGNPAAMPMWYATEEMRQQIYKIAREVFAGDSVV